MRNISIWLLSITGLSFWFIVGFPFANYHESYEWLAQVNTWDTFTLLFSKTGHYASFRPLAQLTALTVYTIFSNLMFMVQILNFGITIVSLFILLNYLVEKKVFSIVLLFAGGLYFLGFTYLFHFQGLFYSPILLLVAVLFALNQSRWTIHSFYLSLLLAVIISMFYPFAFIIYISFLSGLLVEHRNDFHLREIYSGILIIIICIAGLLVLVPGQTIDFSLGLINKTIDIYASIESNLVITLFSLVLSLFTISTISLGKKRKVALLSGVIILAVIFYAIKIPLIILWFLSCLIKMVYQKKWSLFFLLLTTFLFPVFTGAITRNLKFIIIIVSAICTAWEATAYENRLKLLRKRHTYGIVTAVIVITILLTLEIRIPVVSDMVRPLFIVKEKTHQLKSVLEWYTDSMYGNYKLALVKNGTTLENDNFRKVKFPVSDKFLSNYLQSLNIQSDIENQAERTLEITFEDQIIKNRMLVYSVKGKYAGTAFVFLRLKRPNIKYEY